MRLVMAIAALASASSSAQDYAAYSAEKAGSPEFRRCAGSNPSSVEEGQCLAKEYARENRRMQEAFAESLKGTSPAERALRIKAQQEWLVFRRDNCAVRRMSQGSGAGLFYEGCLVRETLQRRTELTDNWDY